MRDKLEEYAWIILYGLSGTADKCENALLSLWGFMMISIPFLICGIYTNNKEFMTCYQYVFYGVVFMFVVEYLVTFYDCIHEGYKIKKKGITSVEKV